MDGALGLTGGQPAPPGALPLWTVVPFAVYLVLVALLPQLAARFWGKNRHKLLVAALSSAPVIAYLALARPEGPRWLAEGARDYAGFVALLLSLFVVTGGIHLRGALDGRPPVNTALLAAGALLASLIGTTGASLLLIRPLLRANRTRRRRAHIVIFFIFIVANGGGMLTPLGDPPLFLGFLRGVPFFWTLRLLGPWAFVNGALLIIFYVFDRTIAGQDARATANARPRDGSGSNGGGAPKSGARKAGAPLRVAGGLNLVWLLGVVGVVYLSGADGGALGASPYLRTLFQVAGLLVMAALSFTLTPRELHRANRFSWAPMAEVAAVFAGIFITMIPALRLLAAQGANLGLTRPWHFFWAAGALSSFLDNAPTYLMFATLAVGVVNQLTGSRLAPEQLAALSAHPLGAQLLTAISCGAVFMGANSYLGNGPNFMVKALAEQDDGVGDGVGDGDGSAAGANTHGGQIRMPSFFGYLAWSGGILLPLFVLVTLIFFR
jgi:Na+/H+ antiporter NhaD/arsenite permease-like protein